MAKEIHVSAPGKVHFLGEHAVVYGNPALIAAVDKRCEVRLSPHTNRQIEVMSQNLKRTEVFTLEEVRKRTNAARENWQEYIAGGNIARLLEITANEMHYPVIAIGETLHYFQRDLSNGFKLTIDSEIPIGAGLGSSAAVAVTVVAATTSYLGEKVDKNVVNDIAFLVEQKKHGMPSGGDNAAVCFGGLIWFRKETPDLKIIQPVPFSISKNLAANFVLIDSGRPAESTGEMVGHLRDLREREPERVQAFLHDQEVLTRGLLTAIKNEHENDVMEIIRKGEQNLEGIGVVSNLSKGLIRAIEQDGGAAKICGAGGKTKGTGIVLAYHPNKHVLQKIAAAHKLPNYQVALGSEGLKVT